MDPCVRQRVVTYLGCLDVFDGLYVVECGGFGGCDVRPILGFGLRRGGDQRLLLAARRVSEAR